MAPGVVSVAILTAASERNIQSLVSSSSSSAAGGGAGTAAAVPALVGATYASSLSNPTVLSVCSWRTSVPVRTRRILIPGLATASLYSSTRAPVPGPVTTRAFSSVTSRASKGGGFVIKTCSYGTAVLRGHTAAPASFTTITCISTSKRNIHRGQRRTHGGR